MTRPVSPENATVSASPYVLVNTIFEILRAPRKNPTGQTDNQDLVWARLLAKELWQQGWRKRGTT